MRRTRLICLLTVLVMSVLVCVPAYALDPSTLYNGSRGEAVRKLQQALIDLGFLKDKADGVFGNKTEEAVRKFQRANNLEADGLVGKKTQAVLFAAESIGVTQESSAAPASETAAPAEPAQTETVPAQAASSASAESASAGGSNLFSGNYSALRKGSTGNRVKIMQQALISLNYLSGKADGKFGSQTLAAVLAFQQQQNLTQDGVAGKKTLTALENAVLNGAKYTGSAAASSETSAGSSQSSASSAETSSAAVTTTTVAKVSAPDSGSIRLLHWFNEIKPTLKNGDHLLIYDPSTGLSWTLRVMSRGRHCDCEPLTQADTDTMVKAFGDKNTWNQKGVYVKLPGGAWTVGSTHDMPHMSGSIKDNGFDGHLCVHFLRNMDEAKANDPNYGVSNQETIRALWKQISGEDITY